MSTHCLSGLISIFLGQYDGFSGTTESPHNFGRTVCSKYIIHSYIYTQRSCAGGWVREGGEGGEVVTTSKYIYNIVVGGGKLASSNNSSLEETCPFLFLEFVRRPSAVSVVFMWDVVYGRYLNWSLSIVRRILLGGWGILCQVF